MSKTVCEGFRFLCPELVEANLVVATLQSPWEMGRGDGEIEVIQFRERGRNGTIKKTLI